MDSLAETAAEKWVFPAGKGDRPLSKDDLWRFRIKARDVAAPRGFITLGMCTPRTRS